MASESTFRDVEKVHADQAFLFSRGDEKALKYFFELFYRPLAFYAFRLVKDQDEAEDIVSVAFVKTWKNCHKLESFACIRAYLYKTVMRDCIHAIHRNSRMNRTAAAAADNEIVEPVFEELVRAEVLREIYEAFNTLSPAIRKVMHEYFIEGKSTGRIAREQQLHPSTVKTQRSAGLKALRNKFLNPITGFIFFLFFSGNL